MMKEEAESTYPVIEVKGSAKPNSDSTVNSSKIGVNDTKRQLVQDIDAFGEVNMEASIASEDVIRAGGYGARDDISSFLPVASDSTDFEATLRDAREYEEPQGETSRPGLGWKATKEVK